MSARRQAPTLNLNTFLYLMLVAVVSASSSDNTIALKAAGDFL